MRLSSFSIRHPAIVTILSIAVLVFGMLSLSTLTQEFLPDVSLPSIMIVSEYPGVEAELVEEQVTSVIEDAMITLQGLTDIESQSRNSVSMITLEFTDNIDVYQVLPEVRATIARLQSSLPEDLSSDPYAFVGGANMLSIFSFAVISDRDPDRLYAFIADEIIPSISRIEGTADVSAYGGRQKEVRIELDLDALESLGIAVLDVYQVLSASNVSLPAGEALYRSGSIYMEVEGEYTTLKELENLVVAYKGEHFITLNNVADITFDYKKHDIFIDTLSRSAVVVDVNKRDDGDTVRISREIRQILDRYAAEYEGVIEFEIIKDDRDLITESLSTTVRSGLIGALMAVVVILLFLQNIRATLIIGLSIPMSVVFSFIGMRFAGQTVNILSLSGLIVALGMVVDSSIVILENIFRLEREGKTPRIAAEQGAAEVGSAVFASGATTIAVFIPLLFLTGIIGVIMKDMSLTIIFALSASLIVSLVMVPFLATHLNVPDLALKNGKIKRKKRFRFYSWMERLYRSIISWALEHKLFVLVTAVVVLLASVFIVSILGVVFIPSADTGDFYIYMKFPQESTLEQSHEKVLRVMEIARAAVPEAEQMLFYTGYSDEYSRSVSNPSRAYGKIILSGSDERERRVQEIIIALHNEVTQKIPGVDVLVENGGFDKLLTIATGGGGFQIELYGNDLEQLYEEAQKVETMLSEDPEVYKATMDVASDQSSLITDLALDHMGRLGISSQEAALTSRILFSGIDVGSFSGDETDDYPIRLTSGYAEQPMTLRKLEGISIPSADGKPISFANFSSYRIDTSISTVKHKDRMKAITVTGYSTDEDTSAIRSRIVSQLEAGSISPAVEWEIAGTTSLMTNSMSKLMLVLVISIFLVYTVMVIQFERFIQPLIIMSSIPFCVIGVILGLLLFGSDISLIAFLGIIALGGIVVNNAIVLIDRMNSGKEEDLKTRIIEASASRLRPVLMTTLTTFFGVLPMALTTGGGSEVYAPLGQAIAGGLVSSTLITLVIIPVLYYLSARHIERKE
jgi:HAE1 family hydrophobic/amphiphilic exporter-1